jgi:lipopolysaccharide/colanic/teichoic acid biosynthesis glycosyltransferase
LIVGDKGPVFFIQKRIGKDGKEFNFFKFRSMVVDADKKLYEYLEQNEEAREEFYKYRKLKNDPRITKVGHFIRNTSLDEFPQFINVLKGDMSLVGPRPYMPREKEDISDDIFNIVTKIKPGITGLWQVSGRSEVTFKDRLEMDREYYYNWSLKEDIKLIFKTIKNCILRKGAI